MKIFKIFFKPQKIPAIIAKRHVNFNTRKAPKQSFRKPQENPIKIFLLLFRRQRCLIMLLDGQLSTHSYEILIVHIIINYFLFEFL